MIFKDENGFLVNETGDSMDSCFRMGIATVFGLQSDFADVYNYVDPIFTPVRHPKQEPANNPKNFSKDQLIPLFAGLYLKKDTVYSRQIFWKLFRRGFFCFNSERDWPGSTKYPWPVKMKSKDPSDNGKLRLFDAPDPLFLCPHVLLFLARCSRLDFVFYLIAPLGFPVLYLNIVFQSKKIESEINAILLITQILGPKWKNLFKKHNPQWKDQVRYYFDRRNESEYADAIIRSY